MDMGTRSNLNFPWFFTNVAAYYKWNPYNLEYKNGRWEAIAIMLWDQHAAAIWCKILKILIDAHIRVSSINIFSQTYLTGALKLPFKRMNSWKKPTMLLGYFQTNVSNPAVSLSDICGYLSQLLNAWLLLWVSSSILCKTWATSCLPGK